MQEQTFFFLTCAERIAMIEKMEGQNKKICLLHFQKEIVEIVLTRPLPKVYA